MESRFRNYKIQEAPFLFALMVSLVGASLVASLAVSGKPAYLLGITFTAGGIGYAVTFLATDIISELFGKRRATQAVNTGFIVLLVSTLLFYIAIILPHADYWPWQEGFKSIFGSSLRITIAGLIAYAVSQNHDVWAFHFWKKVTRGKHLWLRNNLSTISSQFIDAVIFIPLAFYGVFPIIPVILGQFIIKSTIAFLDTPIIYAIVHYARKKIRRFDEVANN